jgi:hypothetical protein
MSHLISQGGTAITKSQMVDRINDIAWQAHQGSVAAIIQLLNQKLANSGVRTRAIFADGVLQLLCEAASKEQLEQPDLVEKIQQILNSIQPRNIRRVNIHSRIVREEQLLWLTEIARDRDDQLLWSQEITLTQPHIFKRLITDLKEVQSQVLKINLPNAQFSRSLAVTKNSSQKRIPAITGLFSLLLLAWLVYPQLKDEATNSIQLNIANSLNNTNGDASKAESLPRTAHHSVSAGVHEPFLEAVRIANQASAAGKRATTSTQWLELAAQWQRASDLMGMVPPDHSRYQEAKIRTQLYQKYSEVAQEEARKSSI